MREPADTEARTRDSEMEVERTYLRLKDDFLTAAAHDLRGPLTAILGEAQLLKRFARNDANLAAYVERIESILAAAVHMKRLADCLLEAGRSGQVGFIRSLERVDLLLLARQVAASFGEQGQRIVVSGEPTSAMVDRACFEVVLTNLVDNALKYSPVGAVVDISVGTEGGSAYVAVKDTGDGIGPADRSVIFERFRRGSGPPAQDLPGAGLGLYTCKRIVEEHGGVISVVSSPGMGSTFRVDLPCQRLIGATIGDSECGAT